MPFFARFSAYPAAGLVFRFHSTRYRAEQRIDHHQDGIEFYLMTARGEDQRATLFAGFPSIEGFGGREVAPGVLYRLYDRDPSGGLFGYSEAMKHYQAWSRGLTQDVPLPEGD